MSTTAPILIIDYGMGNIGSLRNMLRRVGADAHIASDAVSIARAAKILLPGVGAFDSAMTRIAQLDLAAPIRDKAAAGTPILGICLGMQLLTHGSEEGMKQGLGLIPAHARRFPSGAGLKIPHMGWNVVRRTRACPLTEWMNDEDETRFYFVHSYAVEAEERADAILSCTYGSPFDAAINRGSIYGAQFHPEKSHRFGMAFLQAFADLPC